jgi:hypothetical protein
MKKILISLLFIPSLLWGQNTIWNKAEATSIGSNDLFFYSVSNVVKKLKAQTLIDVTQDSSKAYIQTTGLAITSNNAITLSGSGTVWEDLSVSAIQGKQGATSKPDYDYTENALMFPDNDSTEILYIVVQMPHNWKAGSTIYPHVHYLNQGLYQVFYEMRYRWGSIGESFSASAYLPLFTNEYTINGTYHNVAASSTGIAGPGKTISSILLIELYRDVRSGDQSGDAITYSFDIHYEIDALGSKTITTK